MSLCFVPRGCFCCVLSCRQSPNAGSSTPSPVVETSPPPFHTAEQLYSAAGWFQPNDARVSRMLGACDSADPLPRLSKGCWAAVRDFISSSLRNLRPLCGLWVLFQELPPVAPVGLRSLIPVRAFPTANPVYLSSPCG